MKFRDLAIHDKFYMPQYPNCVCIKQKPFGGSCCSPPFNTKIIEQIPKQPVKERVIVLKDDEEITLTKPENINPAQPPADEKVEEEEDIRIKSGYKWHGPGQDPTYPKPTGGGKFGD